MQITITADQGAQLSQMASHEGKVTEELAHRGLAAEAHLISAVKIGQEAARRGDFVEQSALWTEIENALQ